MALRRETVHTVSNENGDHQKTNWLQPYLSGGCDLRPSSASHKVALRNDPFTKFQTLQYRIEPLLSAQSLTVLRSIHSASRWQQKPLLITLL